MKISVTNNDWHTKKIPVKDKTKTVLKNGREVFTSLSMYRKAAKI